MQLQILQLLLSDILFSFWVLPFQNTPLFVLQFSLVFDEPSPALFHSFFQSLLRTKTLFFQLSLDPVEEHLAIRQSVLQVQGQFCFYL